MANLCVLIVEDDEKLATIFSEALGTEGIDTEIAANGNIALERLAVITPDVIVLDLHLPYVSGIDILDKIRADERLAQARVIVVTADLYRAEPLRSKADMVLIKPISFHQLRNLAARLRSSDTDEKS